MSRPLLLRGGRVVDPSRAIDQTADVLVQEGRIAAVGLNLAGPEGAEVRYLDERPPRQAWTLVGCARSREIHRAFYGDEPPTVDMCPRELARALGPAGPTLTKCCLLEEEIEREGDTVVVPWGSSLAQVRAGLGQLCSIAEPTWAPA